MKNRYNGTPTLPVRASRRAYTDHPVSAQRQLDTSALQTLARQPRSHSGPLYEVWWHPLIPATNPAGCPLMGLERPCLSFEMGPEPCNPQGPLTRWWLNPF